MLLELEQELVDSSITYSAVGRDKITGHYIMSHLVGWIIDYERFYLISEEEYLLFGTEDYKKLYSTVAGKEHRDRLIWANNSAEFPNGNFPEIIFYDGCYCIADIYRKKRCGSSLNFMLITNNSDLT